MVLLDINLQGVKYISYPHPRKKEREKKNIAPISPEYILFYV